MRTRRILLLVPAFLVAAFAAKDKDGDGRTQKLEAIKGLPSVAVGDTARLMFHVSPLSAKGQLSQQTHDALKAILRQSGGARLVHIRAFVAGSGDLRRVSETVGDVFGSKGPGAPSLSVVQVGALSLEGAQILIEAVSETKRGENPEGLVFTGAQPFDQLAATLGQATPVQITCFAESAARAGAIAAQFPAVAVAVVQTQRTPSSPDTRCEAVGRGGSVTSPRLAFSGTQIGFGTDPAATGAAFERLDRDLAAAGASQSSVVATNIYAVSGDVRPSLPQMPGVLTLQPFESVASSDGAFAVDVVAAISK